MAQFKTEQDFVNAVLLRFAQKVVAQRIKNVQREKAIATAGLLRSYRYEIRKATVQQTAQALFYFQPHGRFLDMKRVDRKTNPISVKALKEWILDVGLSSFKRLPTKNRTPVGQDRVLNDLAWGISKKIHQRGRTKRRRRKLQTGFYGLVDDLITELMAGYQDRTVEEILKSFNNI